MKGFECVFLTSSFVPLFCCVIKMTARAQDSKGLRRILNGMSTNARFSNPRFVNPVLTQMKELVEKMEREREEEVREEEWNRGWEER